MRTECLTLCTPVCVRVCVACDTALWRQRRTHTASHGPPARAADFVRAVCVCCASRWGRGKRTRTCDLLAPVCASQRRVSFSAHGCSSLSRGGRARPRLCRPPCAARPPAWTAKCARYHPLHLRVRCTKHAGHSAGCTASVCVGRGAACKRVCACAVRGALCVHTSGNGWMDSDVIVPSGTLSHCASMAGGTLGAEVRACVHAWAVRWVG